MYQQAIKKSIEWLLKNQKPDGTFNYSFNPLTGKFSDEDNLVRQAGTAYILSEAYKLNSSQKLLLAVERTINYFNSLGHINKTNIPAFIAMIYTNINDAAFRKKFKQLYQTSSKTILDSQMSGGGFHRLIGSKSKNHSSFADGELFLALTHLYNQNPSANLLKQIYFHQKFFFKHYRELIDIPSKDSQTIKYIKGFYSWSMRALNNLPREKLTPEMLDFALYYSDFVEKTWHIKTSKLENHGVLIEGIASAYLLSKKIQKPSKKLQTIIKAGLKNMLELQFMDNTAAQSLFVEKISKPKLKFLEGSFLHTLNPDLPELRIDFTQHSLGALQIAEKI